MKQLNWDEYFLNLADAASLRSKDPHTKVGCIVIDERKRIIATGYNSLPQGVDDSFWPLTKEPQLIQTEFGELSVCKLDIIAHAELNAIASSNGPLVGATLYSSLCPCNNCATAIITAGIKRVVFKDDRDKPQQKISKLLMKQAGIEVVQIAPKPTQTT